MHLQVHEKCWRGVGGLGHGVNVAAWYGLVQRATADSVRGRVIGASQAFEQCAAALAMVAGAFLVDEMGAQLSYVVPGGSRGGRLRRLRLSEVWALGFSARHGVVLRKRVDHLGA